MKKFSKNSLYLRKSFSEKNSQTQDNYYFDFHKNKGLYQGALNIDNLLSKSLLDDKYTTPQPCFSPSGSFADKYVKQVVAVCLNSKLLESKSIMSEAKEKASQYLKVKDFNIGAYSHSKGLIGVRRNIANWYFERDGYKIDEDEIYMTNGGMNSYDHVISLICESGDSVLLPNPCYPLYKQYNSAYDVESLYYTYQGIDEGKPTNFNYEQLQKTILANREKEKNIKAMVVINPNNPLGNILSEDQMEEVVKFCEKNRLVLIAVESLQNSFYPLEIKYEVKNDDKEYTIKDSDLKEWKSKPMPQDMFKSFRYIINKLNSKLELFSIHSISNGPFFNQAIRGGLLDYMNIDEDVAMQLYKYKSIDLCSGVPSQIFIDLSLNKPKEFGYDFYYNYEKSLSLFNKTLYDAKTNLLKLIKEESDFAVRDIDGNNN